MDQAELADLKWLKATSEELLQAFLDTRLTGNYTTYPLILN